MERNPELNPELYAIWEWLKKSIERGLNDMGQAGLRQYGRR